MNPLALHGVTHKKNIMAELNWTGVHKRKVSSVQLGDCEHAFAVTDNAKDEYYHHYWRG